MLAKPLRGCPPGTISLTTADGLHWEEVVTDPPYVLVLVVANPAEEENRVSIEASLRRIMHAAEEQSQSAPSNSMKKSAQHSMRVRWGGSNVG